ncbi:FKBP-type peptidyl-prolyl cis-trans isomerase [Candidatus Minimicrobia naudis]|uniref:Peptidyl-prolyl cis-trans isomerase n=1 Tax=Candidatus Minimicrobia naudis TaxID=2841263 RepID=A0A8F1SBG7_9BACT|nr:FKBP-type peptidyl-prolyl cis-trans isomerase [Candidatus Minimicrobia naudis]
MATSKGQRIGIWVIAGMMFLGTVGGFVAMMVGRLVMKLKIKPRLRKLRMSTLRLLDERKKKVEAQAAELSQKYYGKFSEFSSRVGAFEAGDVKELGKEDLVEGDGAEVKDDTKLAVYYIGWNAKGEIFDQSIADGKLKAPLNMDGPANTAVIQGWKEGLIGMKIGGVRELTIPADKAYGDQAQGDKIPANSPLKFVVMAIEKPADIPEPEMPEVMKRYYRSRGFNV